MDGGPDLDLNRLVVLSEKFIEPIKKNCQQMTAKHEKLPSIGRVKWHFILVFLVCQITCLLVFRTTIVFFSIIPDQIVVLII